MLFLQSYPYVSPAIHQEKNAKIVIFSNMYGLLSEFLSAILGEGKNY